MSYPRSLTCWKNCPSQGSISIFAKGCPSSYPNAVKPNCSPRACWSNCPNPQSVIGYGVCPSSYPNTIKPNCYVEQVGEQLLNALNEPVSTGGGGFESDKFPTDIANSIQQYNDDNTRPDLPPKTCWSGCPNPQARVYMNGLCSSDYPYELRPNCGGATDIFSNIPTYDGIKDPVGGGGTSLPNDNIGNTSPINEDKWPIDGDYPVMPAEEYKDPTITYVIDNSAEVQALQAQLAQTQQALQDLVEAQSQGEQASQQEIQSLLDFISQQQLELANAQTNNQAQAQVDALESQIYTLQQALVTASSQTTPTTDTTAIDALQQQLATLQQQLATQQMTPYPIDLGDTKTSQAGIGDVPAWAWIGGIVMVGLIVFVATKK